MYIILISDVTASRGLQCLVDLDLLNRFMKLYSLSVSAQKMLYLTSYENDTPLLLIMLCRKLTIFCKGNKSLPKKGRKKEKVLWERLISF